MPHKEKSINYTIFGIIGVALVLLLLIIMSKRKLSPAILHPQTTPKLTAENEFSQNIPDGTDVIGSSPKSIISNTESQKLTLALISPANGSTVKTQVILVKGKTLANAEVFVNEIDAKADANGNFSVSYTLEEGENYLVIGANSTQGAYRETEVKVTYEP